MKPDWKDAPEWARWICQDPDGRWIWFECKPVCGNYFEDWRLGKNGGRWDYVKVANKKWRETLERRS